MVFTIAVLMLHGMVRLIIAAIKHSTALPNQFDTRETLSYLSVGIAKTFWIDSEELYTSSMINLSIKRVCTQSDCALLWQLIAALPEDDSESVNESASLLLLL